MNTLAVELNDRLSGTTSLELLSDFGKRFFFPKGIAAQSAEATAKASRYNATIGMAFERGEPMILPSLKSSMGDLTAGEAVAYAPNAGDAVLRKLWAEEIRKKNPDLGSARIGTPTVVTGLTNGIAHLADLFVDPGDPVVIPDMFWGNYRLIFETRKGGRIVTYPFFDSDGTFNVEEFRGALRGRREHGKAVVLLNFPNNPTGYSPSTDEVDAIAEAIRDEADAGTRLLLITDDAYFGLFYEPETYRQSIFAKTALLHPNLLTAKVDGATKEDFAWGFRVGFVTFAGEGMTDDHLSALERKLLGAIRSSISNSSRPAQSLLVKLLQSRSHEEEKRRCFELLAARYRTVREIVCARDTAVLDPLPFNSGYFMSFRVVCRRAELLRRRLLDERSIGTIAIKDDFLRIAYSAVDEEDIAPLYEEVYRMASSVATESAR